MNVTQVKIPQLFHWGKTVIISMSMTENPFTSALADETSRSSIFCSPDSDIQTSFHETPPLFFLFLPKSTTSKLTSQLKGLKETWDHRGCVNCRIFCLNRSTFLAVINTPNLWHRDLTAYNTRTAPERRRTWQPHLHTQGHSLSWTLRAAREAD